MPRLLRIFFWVRKYTTNATDSLQRVWSKRLRRGGRPRRSRSPVSLGNDSRQAILSCSVEQSPRVSRYSRRKKKKWRMAKSASGECEENVRPSDDKRLSTIANCRQRVAGEKVRHFFFSESMIRRRTHDAYNVQWSRLFRYGRISKGDVTRAIRIFAFLVLALRKSSTRESLHLLRLFSILSRLLYLGSSHRFSRVASFVHVCLLFLTQSARNRDEPRTYTRKLLSSKFYRASSTTKSSSNIKRQSLNFCFASNAYINIYEYQMPLFLRYIATPTSCRLHNVCRLAIFFEDISRHGSAVSVIRL